MWNEQPKIRIEQRIEILLWVFLALFIFLIVRLWYLSILETSLYQQKSDMNRIRITTLQAPRGNIYDRYGKILAQDTPRYVISYLPEKLETSEIVIRLEDILGRPVQDSPRIRPSGEILLSSSISLEEVVRIEEARREIPGIMVETQPNRIYPAGDALAHVIGYIGRIDEVKLQEMRKIGYDGEDLVGKSGIELYYDSILRGEKGYRRVEVDALGTIVRMIDGHPPRFTNSVMLTIDLELQQYCQQLLEDRKGVIIVGDPRTGELLAIASTPSFDPNRLVQGVSHQEWTQLVQDPRLLFHNRPLQSLYPPGSLFKLLLAIGALEENLTSENRRIFCPGHYDINDTRFVCWRRSGHGSLNIVEGIAHSCNVHFYQLGLELGVEGINRWASNFLLDSPSGIDLPDEQVSLFPDNRWKRQRFAESWFPGDTLNYSIGQGYLLMTPLTIYRLFAGIASRGTLYQPHIMHSIIGNDGTVDHLNSPQVLKQLNLRTSTWNLVFEGMRRTARDGTGRALRDMPVSIAAKTGTAQNPHGENHAWTGGFFPVDEPEIAFLVLIEHGGDGSGIAATISRSTIEWYLSHRRESS